MSIIESVDSICRDGADTPISTSDGDFVSVELPLFRALCCLFWLRCSVSLLLQATGPAVVLSRQYSYKT